jgi:sugar phosphate isomerase/epimerase
MAKLLGCDKWVVHPIMPNLLRDIPEGTAENTWQLNVEFMGWLLDYARQVDVTICLENMPHRNFSMAKPEKVLELAQLMNDPHFAVCLDFGHVATQENLSVADQIRLLGNQLQAVHIHDNDGLKDQHSWPGEGVIDWTEAAKALKEIGYQGVFSLETAPFRDPAGDGNEKLPAAEFLEKAKKLIAATQQFINE